MHNNAGDLMESRSQFVARIYPFSFLQMRIQNKYISNRQVRGLKCFNSTNNIEWQLVDLGRLNVISDSFVANLQLRQTNKKTEMF